MDRNTHRADAFFNSLGIPGLFGASPNIQVRLWERTLSILRTTDGHRYQAIHKGTPFYFLGVGSYMAQDFEGAMYYMDCALTQDVRLHGERWHLVPSGMFVRLDETPENQFGRELVRQSCDTLANWNAKLLAMGATCLSLESY